MKFKRGQVLYKQGKPCDGLYLIKQGQFEVVKECDMANIMNSTLNSN